MHRCLLLIIGLLALLGPRTSAEEIILCGWDEVFILQVSPTGENPRTTWTWKAAQCEQLPAALRRTFATTDDCKPVDGGRRILISSSSGGCAVVERPSGKATWYARAPNAHSIELLPENRIVVASSINAQGNKLVLFDLARPDQPIWDTPLVSAHGVVWDESRQLLWALGQTELRGYALRDWTSDQPSLSLTDSYPLPTGDGHDLQPVPKSDDLIVTTGRGVYLFDRQSRRFRPHPELGDRPRVKSVNVHPVTGQMVLIEASQKAWWNDTVELLSPPGTIRLPDLRLYKARWLVHDDSP